MVADVYNSSTFVIGGLGYNQLDCCRYYEAIISGAIPILVSQNPNFERSKIFDYNGHPAPFIIAKSWESAFIICQSMAIAEIEGNRSLLFNWYNSTVNRLYTSLASALKSSRD